NGGDGVLVDSGDQNRITQNSILSNLGDGVGITGLTSTNGKRANLNVIGDVGEGNTIAFNDGFGLFVSFGDQNSIRQNSIFSNFAGIHLSFSNGLIKAPVLTSAVSTGAAITINGTLQREE